MSHHLKQQALSRRNLMHALRTSIRRVPAQLNRINKPSTTVTATRSYRNTPTAMSLFPRFTQEFSPLFRLLDDYERHAFRSQNSLRTFSPKFDVKELKDGYELHGEFPGVEQKDINIEWTDANTLTITGRHETVREEGTRPTAAAIEDGSQDATKKIEEKKEHQPSVEDENPTAATPAGTENQVAKSSTEQSVAKHNENEPKYWVSERSVGSFHRSFNFPARVDQDGVKASLKNGILSVLVPKAKKTEPKKVVIE